MAEWITLQETADKVGVRKGTLAMWRNRNQFPFKTEGDGKSLRVEVASVEDWLKKHKDDVLKGRNRPRKPLKKAGKKAAKTAAAAPASRAMKKRGRKPGRKRGRKPGRKPGRPAGVRAAGRPAKPAAGLLVKGATDLAALQRFVADIKGGCKVQALPVGDGTLLTTAR